MPPTKVQLDQILLGNATEVLQTLPKGFVDCVVTSPPYFQLRKYDDAADSPEIGREPSPTEYVESLVTMFEQVAKVLKPTGTLWLVLGDKYLQNRLQGLPWRVALALQDAGWYLRSDIIWQKPNAMPSPVKNRPTTDHEYVFLLTRQADYHYDADAIREPHVTFTDKSKMKGGRKHFGTRGGTPEAGKNGGDSNLHDGRWDQAFHPAGRNKRTVWSIPLSKFREAHFAVFPESLVETCILAGCPEGGVVLDPCCGSGTTLVVAQRLGRKFLGVDCVERYCEMARERVASASE